MVERWPDCLVFQATGFGECLTAQQAIDRARKFLLGLEAVSPWRRPFDVSGITVKHANLRIAEDLSDFDQVVMRALSSYTDVKYTNPGKPENWHLTSSSLSPYGFRTSFSDYIQRKKQSQRVDVSLKSSGSTKAMAHFVSVITIRKFLPGEVNERWSQAENVRTIFDYMIDFFDPINCIVYSHKLIQGITDINADRFLLGWLTYTRNPRFRPQLVGTPRVRDYRDGILIELGDDASVLSDPKNREYLTEIRDKLRAAGIADWLKME